MFNKLLDPEGSQLPRLAELGPQIGAEVQRLSALTLTQLAAEVMTRAFTPEFIAGGLTGLGAVAGYFLPDYGPPRAGDSMSLEEYELRDLVAEGLQVLEQARLIRPAFGYNGNVAGTGWVTTRLGRSALASRNVPAALEQVVR